MTNNRIVKVIITDQVFGKNIGAKPPKATPPIKSVKPMNVATPKALCFNSFMRSKVNPITLKIYDNCHQQKTPPIGRDSGENTLNYPSKTIRSIPGNQY